MDRCYGNLSSDGSEALVWQVLPIKRRSIWPEATRPLGCRPPAPPPIRRLPTVGDVDRLARDPVPAKLEDADTEFPGPLVVADRDLRDPEVPPSPHLPELDRRGC